MTSHQETIDNIVENTIQYVGTQLAESYPAAKTGDVSHGTETVLRGALDNMVSEWIENNVTEGAEKTPEVIFWRDHEGRIAHMVCPHCGAEDSILECDTAVRQNRLLIGAPGKVISSLGDGGDYETDRYECDECSKEVDFDGSLISEWL